MFSIPARIAPGDGPEIASLHDRRAFELKLEEAIANMLRLRASMALLLLSIESFTVFARSPAPQAAEAVLAAAGESIRSCLRAGDAIGRMAPNRLAIMVMECDEEKLAVVAARFIDAVSGQPMVTAVGPVALSVAMGGVVLPRQARNAENALNRAGAALSRAIAGEILPGTAPRRLSIFAQGAEI